MSDPFVCYSLKDVEDIKYHPVRGEHALLVKVKAGAQPVTQSPTTIQFLKNGLYFGGFDTKDEAEDHIDYLNRKINEARSAGTL